MQSALSMQMFKTPSGQLAAQVAGLGQRRVLLLHGNSSCKEAFAAQVQCLLEAGYSVLAPDLPGHGASQDASDPETTYSFPGYARPVASILDNLSWQDYAIVGWSLGGHIALELLAADPRVLGVMIVGTPPVKPEPESLQAAFHVTEHMNLAGQPHFTPDDARAYLAQMLGCEGDLPPHLLAAALRTDGRARYWMMRNGLAGIGTDARCLVGRTDRPIAILHGALEPFVRLDYLQGLNCPSRWRNAIQIFETDGHAPHWTNPAAFNAMMLEFLSDLHARR